MSRQDIRKRVCKCAGQLFAEKGYVSPVDLLVKMNTILVSLREFAKSMELKPSVTVYMSWGKVPKQRLRFSKYGSPHVEEMYATHYARPNKARKTGNG
ncbi:hypothetical protein [Effusibacillus dendaii]|uniref:Uncharacterized protein n=1 Tax=Effusibacillus dendaii TaxID=2743772 RepID=A0A7I8D6P2_9BACL|nr:hypothetical protein [Effusibacillus dendaii]BCJ85667.1 hypothetical protein skT53_06520 [Effusibacillus dendaii]